MKEYTESFHHLWLGMSTDTQFPQLFTTRIWSKGDVLLQQAMGEHVVSTAVDS